MTGGEKDPFIDCVKTWEVGIILTAAPSLPGGPELPGLPGRPCRQENIEPLSRKSINQSINQSTNQ